MSDMSHAESPKIDIYLACPYSHPDPAVMEQRFHAANRAAARLIAQGKTVFSPLSHSHPIAVEGGLAVGWEYWGRFDLCCLSFCSELVILTLDGWRESTGLMAEYERAKELHMPVRYSWNGEAMSTDSSVE